MVALTFIFEQENIAKAGYSEEELLQPMRDHAEKYNISEVEHGVFAKDGEDALCTVSMAIPLYTDMFPEYDTLLSEWTLDVDGEKEDCIQETREWFANHGKQEKYSMENEQIIQPLTPEIMEEADEETSRQMEYYSTHREELRNMTEEEFFRAMMKAAKED